MSQCVTLTVNIGYVRLPERSGEKMSSLFHASCEYYYYYLYTGNNREVLL